MEEPYCVICKKDSASQENPIVYTGCCSSRIHEKCIDRKLEHCLICKDKMYVIEKHVRKERKFTTQEAEESEKSFLNHYDLYVKPKPML